MNSTKERKRFNVVDALIIVLIALLILVVIFRAQLIALFNDSGTKKEVTITFVCESIPNEIVPSITNDSRLRWVESDVELGILALGNDTEDAKIFYYDDAGELCVRISQSEKSFSGMIYGTAVDNNGCYIDGTDFIAAGMTVTLTNGKAQFTALITDVIFK